MTTVVIIGADLGDAIFSIDLSGMASGKDTGEVTWNVTRLQQAADRGAFGLPVMFPMSGVKDTDYSKGYMERSKVAAFKMMPNVLSKPALLIQNPPGHQFEFACFCDGQHRIAARHELGLPEFAAFVIPWDKQFAYRVTEKIIPDVPQAHARQ